MKINHKEVCVVTRCPFCGKVYEVEVNEMDYLDWQNGALIQDVMPYLSAQEREYLISGICEDCWGKMFGSNEDLIQQGTLGIVDDYALEFMEHLED